MGAGRPLTSLVELQAGDYVVHVSHGIARYLGLARLEKSGRPEDYLTLQFADQVKVYIPAAQIDLVSKYIGSAAEPELSKLGGKMWARKKERAQGRAARHRRRFAESSGRAKKSARNLLWSRHRMAGGL